MKITKRQLRRIIREAFGSPADYYEDKRKAVSEVQKEIEAAYRVLKALERGSQEYADQKSVIAALEDKRLYVGYTGD